MLHYELPIFRGYTLLLSVSIITCQLTYLLSGVHSLCTLRSYSVSDTLQTAIKKFKCAQIRPQHGCRCQAPSSDLKKWYTKQPKLLCNFYSICIICKHGPCVTNMFHNNECSQINSCFYKTLICCSASNASK